MHCLSRYEALGNFREHSNKVAKRSPISRNSTQEPRKFADFRASLCRWGWRSCSKNSTFGYFDGTAWTQRLRFDLLPRLWLLMYITISSPTFSPSGPGMPTSPFSPASPYGKAFTKLSLVASPSEPGNKKHSHSLIKLSFPSGRSWTYWKQFDQIDMYSATTSCSSWFDWLLGESHLVYEIIPATHSCVLARSRR